MTEISHNKNFMTTIYVGIEDCIFLQKLKCNKNLDQLKAQLFLWDFFVINFDGNT